MEIPTFLQIPTFLEKKHRLCWGKGGGGSRSFVLCGLAVNSSKMADARGDLIEAYFKMGYCYNEIVICLFLSHGIEISIRHLKRILAQKGLGRCSFTDVDDIVSAIDQELTGSGSTIGYRSMWQRLKVNHGISVSKEYVRKALRVIDPEGVDSRLRHRLKRRRYSGKGPNFVWHIDGYDKLKPFGFCIHGCIDGFSRRIMWLEVASTNNHPGVIAKYFIDCIQEVGGVASVVRADNGTENVRVAAIQRFLRREARDDWSTERSFLYGKSVSNQRIEAWWGQLRKGCTDWWISHFKDLRDKGLYCDSNIVHSECLQFCYMGLIRDELRRASTLWNLHRIRPSTNESSPPGRPDMLYNMPETSNTVDYRHEVDMDDIEIARELCCSDNPPLTDCCPEFEVLAQSIVSEEGLQMPTDAEAACNLYLTLINEIESIM